MFAGQDPEGKIRAAGEEMTVFGHERIRPHPFGVGRDEGVSRFESLAFVFGTELEGNEKIFIHARQSVDQFCSLTKDISRKIAADFFKD